MLSSNNDYILISQTIKQIIARTEKTKLIEYYPSYFDEYFIPTLFSTHEMILISQKLVVKRQEDQTELFKFFYWILTHHIQPLLFKFSRIHSDIIWNYSPI
jgi:hypothetical protein